MAERPTLNPEPDESCGPPGIVRLDRQHLLADLANLQRAESLSDLQDGVSALKRRLPALAEQEESPDRDKVEFGAAYLFDQLDQVHRSLTLERARHYLRRLAASAAGEKTSPINDINLNRWKEYDDLLTDSLWLFDKRDSTGVHSAGYWGNFIPQIPNQMMRRYTKPGDWVLDPFAGSGTTLIEGQRLGRNTLGIELQPRMVGHAARLVSIEPNPHGVSIGVHQGDAAAIDYGAILRARGIDAVQLVLMHPPYHDIIQFSEDPSDLSNAPTVDEFLSMMGKVVDRVTPLLDRGRYLALVIGDKYEGGDWIPLGFQTMNEVMKRGYSLKSTIVKNFDDTSAKRTQKELWRYRALAGGFYVFKHEYIFVFRKR